MTDKTTPTRGATAQYTCKCCGGLFIARVADRKRGWARFCSKSCKATKQEARTGQHRDYMNRRDNGGLCFPSHAEGDIQ